MSTPPPRSASDLRGTSAPPSANDRKSAVTEAHDADLIATEKTQRRVADPAISAWVEANAGAGKTTVLTDRVIRLLLNGSRPENILCITFTKAAAAEMKERLFSRLGRWALMPDEALAAELAALDLALDPALSVGGVSSVPASSESVIPTAAIRAEPALHTPSALSRARKLFARALETPGGLKIQTIHSFCESILRRFPLEANISPSFRVIEESQARALYRSIIDAKAAALTHPGSVSAEPPPVIRQLLDRMGKTKMLHHLEMLIAHRTEILRAISVAGGRSAYLDGLGVAGGVPVSMTVYDLKSAYKEKIDTDEIKSLIDILRTEGGKRAIERAGIFDQMIRTEDPDHLFSLARETFLTRDGSPYGEKFLYTKKTDKVYPGASDRLICLQNDFANFFTQAVTLRDLELTRCLLDCAIDVIEAYQALKQQQGFLDFSDLITSTVGLFKSTSADWVLYKLDTGLDHILLDEAQDTSAAQWAVVMAPLREFFAGAGQINKNRTVFVVGDEKQSIYSFQGADINLFRQYRDTVFALGSVDQPILRETIDISFRSAAPVLRFVDTTFNDPQTREGFLTEDIELKHRIYKKGAAGLVEIWPLIEAEEKTGIRPWDAPVDSLYDQSATTILARDITAKIKALLDDGFLDAEDRPVTAADILVLFRKRGPIFHELLKQLVRAGIPISGADRLKIKDNILVNDMIAAASFILQPDDNLSLAVFLKSPFVGFSEDELYELCFDRKESLWVCLQKSMNKKSIRAVTLLREIRRVGILEGPVAFFTHLLDYTGTGDLRMGGPVMSGVRSPNSQGSNDGCSDSDAQRPNIQTPDVQNPGAQNPGAQNPGAQTPNIQDPSLKGPDIQDTDIQYPDIQDPVLSGWARGKARLGEIITDPVTEFLNEAFAYEANEARSLQGFLKYFFSLDTTIKRDLDTTDTAVRLMTVHGAKGLQAPIVILADAGQKMTKNASSLQPLPDPRLDYKFSYPGYYLYNDKRNSNDPTWGAAVSPLCERALECVRRDEEEESKRLLYVAATRAEYQLYITGCVQKGAAHCWHALASRAFDVLAEEESIETFDTAQEGSPAGARRLSSPQSTLCPPLSVGASSTRPLPVEPVAAQPALTRPALTRPALTRPALTRPVSPQPVSGQPGAFPGPGDGFETGKTDGQPLDGAKQQGRDHIETSLDDRPVWPAAPVWLYENAPMEKKISILAPSNMLGERYDGMEARRPETVNIDQETDEADTGVWISPDPTGKRLDPLPGIDHDLSKDHTRADPSGAHAAMAISPLLRGVMLHKLLEILPALPAGERIEAAQQIVSRGHPDIPAAMRESWICEVMQVLETPAFRAVFSQEGRAEVSLRGNLTINGREYPVSGQIDRLIVTARKILIVDYKTNRPPPATATGVPALYLEQLAIYRALIGVIYPHREVACALLWTYVSHLMPIPGELLDDTYQRFCEKIAALNGDSQ